GYRTEGPLDMRMYPSGPGPTAADLVNDLPEEELADLIFTYGEERQSRRVARAIVRARQRGRIEATGELAGLVAGALGRRPGRAGHRAGQGPRGSRPVELTGQGPRGSRPVERSGQGPRRTLHPSGATEPPPSFSAGAAPGALPAPGAAPFPLVPRVLRPRD